MSGDYMMNSNAKLAMMRKPVLWAAISSIVFLAAAGCSDDDDQPAPEPGKPVANPYLSAPLYGITHINSSQSDSTPYGPPDGQFTVDPAQQPIVYGGPITIMTLAATDPDFSSGAIKFPMVSSRNPVPLPGGLPGKFR
jgi:hypothetical protein